MFPLRRRGAGEGDNSLSRNVSSRIDERDKGEKIRTRDERESIERAIERAREFYSFFFPPSFLSLSLFLSLCCICLSYSVSRTVVTIMACTHCTDPSLSRNNPKRSLQLSHESSPCPATPLAATLTSFILLCRLRWLCVRLPPNAGLQDQLAGHRGTEEDDRRVPQRSFQPRGGRLRQVPTSALHLQRWAAWS